MIQSMLNATHQEIIILSTAAFAILFGIINAHLVLKIPVNS